MPIKRNITIENARLLFRNFSGNEGQFNPKGRRNFCVCLDDGVADELKEEGYNVRWLEPRDSQDRRQAYLQIRVAFEHVPPKIITITSKGKTVLEEGNITILDWAELATVDLIFQPYHWEYGGKRGVTAYLKSMYVTLVEDELEAKYTNVPDSAASILAAHDEEPF